MQNKIIAASTGALVPAPNQGQRPAEMTEAIIRDGLTSFAAAGFEAIELSDIWVDSRTATSKQLQILNTAIADAGMAVVGLSTLGLERSDQALSAAIDAGAPTLCLGLHQMPGSQASSGSFWATPPEPHTPTDADFAQFSEPLAALCKRAHAAGLNVVIEMNEHAIIDRAAHVLRLLDMTDAPNLGVNPDLGNLTRVTVPMIETWYETLEKLAEFTRYWHVKNNLRLDHPSGFVVTHPCAMDAGIIDYREAMKILDAQGFSGPIVIESYWGDRMRNLQLAKNYLSEFAR